MTEMDITIPANATVLRASVDGEGAFILVRLEDGTETKLRPPPLPSFTVSFEVEDSDDIRPGDGLMAATQSIEVSAIMLALDPEQAMALAQLCKRFTWEHAKSLSNAHDGGQERDLMLDAVGVLARALAEQGYSPR